MSEAWPDFRFALSRACEHEALARAEAPPGLLSPREHQALAGLRFEARRRKWLLGRFAAKALLREVLAEQRGLAPEPSALTIGNEASGAPFAELEGEGRLPWPLSISHRGELGLCAVSTDCTVALGADLETVEPRDPSLLRTFFTPHEQSWVAGDPRAELAIARIWSAKESVLKALGLGLRLDPREIEVRAGVPGSPCAPGWQALEIILGPGVPRAAGQSWSVAWRDEGRFVLSIALRVRQ